MLKKPIVVVIACFVLLIAVAVAIHMTSSDTQRPVGRQWCDEIAKYSIRPIFPPRDDLAVGDVFPVNNIEARPTGPRPARWKRLALDPSKIKPGKALLPEYSVTTSSETDISALAPWQRIEASLGAQGARLKSAKIVMEDVTTESIDGVEILNSLRDWDEKKKVSVIKPMYLRDLRVLSSKTNQSVRLSVVSELYQTKNIRIQIKLSGKGTGKFSAGMQSKLDDTTRITMGEMSNGSFSLDVEKVFQKPIAVGAVGYTYDVNTSDGTFSVSPVVTSGAGSGGMIE